MHYKCDLRNIKSGEDASYLKATEGWSLDILFQSVWTLLNSIYLIIGGKDGSYSKHE
jgi:hypothetical protein